MVGKSSGSNQNGASRDEGSARCCSAQSVLTGWSASRGRDMGVYGLAAARSATLAVQAAREGSPGLLPAAHSSPSARSAIQRRPGCTFKRSPAPVAAPTAGVWSALALGQLELGHWHDWPQSSCYTFPSAARFTLSPISLALSLSETALSHLHHPACALRRAAYRCLSCQNRAAKLQQAPTAS